MRHPLGIATVAALALTPVASAATYSLTPLGDLPGGTTASWGADLNDRGEAVGESSSAATSWVEGFYWSAGAMSPMGNVTPSPFWSRPEAVNNRRMATGHSLTPDGWQAFRYTPAGGMVGLGYAGGCVGGEGQIVRTSYGYGINDLDQIVGQTTTASCIPQAFIWDAGSWQLLGVLDSGDSGSRAHDIDAAGLLVVGTSFRPNGLRKPFVWDGGGLIPLPYPFDEADATALNDGGEMVGIAYDLSGASHHALYWPPGGGPFTDLGFLYPGHTLAHAWDINDAGQIVGESAGGADSDAFLYEPGVGLQDLELMLDASGAGWDLTSARGINDAGQIVGTGVNPAGVTEAYLLTPVTDPTETGACCLPDGTCAQLNADDCKAKRGQFQGYGSLCEDGVCQPDPTPIPEAGACCYPDGSCTQTIGPRCEATGGMFAGPGTLCSDGVCDGIDPIELGACCLDDACIDATADDCLQWGGTYHGDGSSCSDVDCTPGGCHPPTSGGRDLSYGWGLLGIAAVVARRRRLLSRRA